MSKASIVVDFAYVSPHGSGRKRGHRHLRAKLKYLQYRDDRHGHIRQGRADARWRDHGLGRSYRAIQDACGALQSKHVLAWTWVISPAPDLMALVPDHLRRDLVIDLTERVVESYYVARGMDIPEYAFVVHDRLARASSGESPGLQHLHTHVILPGTAPTLEGRQPVYNNKDKGHDRLVRAVASQHFEAVLDAVVGERWRELRREPEVVPLPDPNDLEVQFPRER